VITPTAETRDFHPREAGEAPQPPEAYSLAEFAGIAEKRQMAAIGPGCFAAQVVRASGVGIQALLRPEARDDRSFPSGRTSRAKCPGTQEPPSTPYHGKNSGTRAGNFGEGLFLLLFRFSDQARNHRMRPVSECWRHEVPAGGDTSIC